MMRMMQLFDKTFPYFDAFSHSNKDWNWIFDFELFDLTIVSPLAAL